MIDFHFNRFTLKYLVRSYRNHFVLSVIISAAFISYSCETKIAKVEGFEILSLPSLTGKDIYTVFTDSGKVQMIMAAPMMETWDNFDSPYTEFRLGMKIYFHDGHKEPAATASAKYAKFVEKENLWELNDSVVIVNESGDKLETEQLFWDRDKNLVFTDRFVKITNEDQTVMGTGFESDPQLTRRRIKNVTATIYLHDE
ncbi:MAG: LPS export ABC transporter periplasmic protein LptC [Bacteroidetes bacterium RBG_13_43_22]|nr:MAG: LPS export ABC transporter periplasmic protein LptC [Bacteroidetes bacterium RBG_13_43_22]